MKPALRAMERRLGGWRAALLAKGGPPSRRLLLVSDGREYTSEEQFAPIWRHQLRLRRELGLSVRWLPLDIALRRGSAFFARFDIIGFKLSFRTPAVAMENVVARLQAALAGTTARLVCFDGDDDSGIMWPGLLDRCDLYVKKHIFADPHAYARRFVGKSNLTNHVAITTGRSFAGDIIPSSGGIDPARLGKLHLGWNVALDDKIAALAPHPPEAERPVDICSRAWAASDNWLEGLRAPAVAALAGIDRRWIVNVPQGRVPQREYYREMRSAKICVSPFGYGEICWRDFEAIMSGCLLVKPDMGHIRTAPDLFVPGETYLPVAWDYADLETVCSPWLADAAARIRIARQAQERLLEALSAGWFVDQFAQLLRRL